MTDTHTPYTILATHCCMCRLPLKDAESVEHGIGPICSKKYYNPQHVPTDQQVRLACGMLVQMGLPEEVRDCALSFRNDARLLSNVLVKYASSVYDQRDEVFKCATIMRTLGYVELADKLEEDRTRAVIRDQGDHLHAYAPYKLRFNGDMDKIPGVIRLQNADGTQAKIGSKIGWHIPADQKDYFEAVLGFAFGGELACGDGKVWTIRKRTFAHILAFRAPAGAQTIQAPNGQGIRLTLDHGRLDIFTPFNPFFKDDLKARINYKERSWTGSCWRVLAKHEGLVKSLIQTHYGVQL